MAKKLGLINPAQLWGKPLRSVASQKAEGKKVTGTMTHDEDVTDDEIDVDAELAPADAKEDELRAIEAESETEVTDDIEDGDPEENAEDDEPEYSDDDSDVSDQTEDAVEADEEVVTAVVDENEEEVGEAEIPATTGKSSMSEKMSLSDHVRAEIARRQKAGETPIRGKDIVETLAKRKLNVSPAQVSQLLKKAGLGGQPRGKKAEATVAAGVEKSRAAGKGAKKNVTPAPQPNKVAAKARPETNGFRVPMEQLQAAEAFVASCGGSFQSAERILTAAAQLSQTFGN
jgi:hypothetical protein